MPAANAASQRLQKLGEVVSKTLECEPRRSKIIERVHEKFSCRDCEGITEAPAPSYSIPRGFRPEPVDDCPGQQVPAASALTRRSKTFARERSRSMSRRWRIESGLRGRFEPLVQSIGAHVLSAERIHANDTTVLVLAKLKTVLGRI